MESLEKKIGISGEQRILELLKLDPSFKKDYSTFADYEKQMSYLVHALQRAPVAFAYSPAPEMDVARALMASEAKSGLTPFSYNTVPATSEGNIIGESFDSNTSIPLTKVWSNRVESVLSSYDIMQSVADSIDERLKSKSIDLSIKDDNVAGRLAKGAYVALSLYIDKTLALASQSMYDVIQANVATGRRLNKAQVPRPQVLENGKHGVRYEVMDLESPIVDGAISNLSPEENLRLFSDLEYFKEVAKKYEIPEVAVQIDKSFDSLVGRQYDAMLETARFCYQIGRIEDADRLVNNSNLMQQFGYVIDESDKSYTNKIRTGEAKNFGEPIEFANPSEALARTKNYLFPDMSPKARAIKIPARMVQQMMSQAKNQYKR